MKKINLNKSIYVVLFIMIFVFGCFQIRKKNRFNSSGEKIGRWYFSTSDSVVYLKMNYKNDIPCKKTIAFDTNGRFSRVTVYRDDCKSQENRSYILKGFDNGKIIYRDVVYANKLKSFKIYDKEKYREKILLGIPHGSKEDSIYQGSLIYETFCSSCHSCKEIIDYPRQYDAKKLRELFAIDSKFLTLHDKLIYEKNVGNFLVHAHFGVYNDDDFRALLSYIEECAQGKLVR